MELETPRQVYQKFLDVLANERESPELLEYEETLVECLIEQVEHMETNIVRLRNRLEPFCIEQHRTEIDRIQYCINAYLRTRIQKIETNCISLVRTLKADASRAQRLMSAGELKYLDSYFHNLDSYLGETVLGRLELPVRDASHTFALLDLPRDDRERNQDTYVFVKAKRETDILVDSEDGEQDTITMASGSIHFLPYAAVRHQLINSNTDNLVLL